DPGSPSGRNFRRRSRDDSQQPDSVEQRSAKLHDFCRRFVERAFRQPLTSDEIEFFIERQLAEAKDEETAVQRVALLALKSPRFLYRDLGGRQEPGGRGPEPCS